MKLNSCNDDDYFRLLQQGDSAAFHHLIRIYFPVLGRYACRVVRISSAEAEDVIEEVFIKLWERRAQFAGFGEVKGFLYTSVRNGCLNVLRSRQREETRATAFMQLYGNESGDSDKAEIIYSELLAEIRKSIDSLPAKMREIFILSHYKKMSNEAIAAHLNLSHQTVRNQKSKALALLRQWLKQKDPLLLVVFSIWLHR
ncbi:RNA polymerase sigma-70 factor [Agriterribacter sp.]|uniref:RNA polymerase sigma-70 factor n=1 Tax=Agriterribacter sp. TaxID=2821509 RepID=UPI002BC55FAF|nr:RNA polymerase sigma-70 factor [Agriterribacter sp.]HRP55755.1 RNA polymerase sigma-70 factor [Agriterribacter sp.]